MSSPPDLTAVIANRLTAAQLNRAPCDPVHAELKELGPEGAYAVQDLLTQRALSDGRRLVGRKIGLTSKGVQQQLGVDQPDYGMLFEDMVYGEDEEISLARLIQPRVEAEIAFVLERDLIGPSITLADAATAIAYALPAIEVVDSRIRDWKISLLDTIADNASAGLVVLGGAPTKIDAFDLRLCGMTMENRGDAVSVGCGAACLGNPLNAVVWLARKMVEVGRPLRAGDVLLSGALGPMVEVAPGEVYDARINGLGRVAAAFSLS